MICKTKLEASWQKQLKDELEKPYVTDLQNFLENERMSGQAVFPPKELVFNAFQQTPFDKVNVVIVGQDPYHRPNQAHGLSFSVQKGISLPPSLQNIFKEVAQDIGEFKKAHGCLLSWAEQGVLLLNSILTVRQGQPASHQGKGWETFTNAALMRLNRRERPLVFMLWGKYAQQKGQHLNSQKHLILKCPHPSPFSAHTGFFGCRHFSAANEFLKKNGQAAIDWHRLG